MERGEFEFTFPDSGETVILKRWSWVARAELRAAWRADNPPPTPPLKTFGEGEEAFTEPDEANPGYVRALRAWTDRLNRAMELQTRYIYAAVCLKSEPDPDAVEEILNLLPKLRDQLVAEFAAHGLRFEQDIMARYIYLWYCAQTTQADYMALVEVMTRRAQPTEQSVAAVAQSF